MSRRLHHNVASALSHMAWQERAALFGAAPPAPPRDAARFAARQMRRMPGFMKPVFVLCAWALTGVSLVVERRPFCRLPQERRLRVARLFRRLPGPCADYVRFFETLCLLYLFERAGEDGP